MGWLLSSLTNSKKKSLFAALNRKYDDIVLVEKDFQELYLGAMTHEQLYDLLKLAQAMKETDFDSSKLMRVQEGTKEEGRARGVGVGSGGEESSFEIEDESD